MARTFTRPDGTAFEGALIEVATATLNDAAIKALPTSAGKYTLIAAPGANKIVVPVATVVKINALAAYTSDADAHILCVWSGDPTYPIGCAVPSLMNLNLALGIINYGVPALGLWAGQLGGAAPQFVNQPTYLVSMPDFYGSGWPFNALTGGNAANTLFVTVYYIVVDVP
jgi:hypothetical protein